MMWAGRSDNEWECRNCVYRRVAKVKRACRHENEWCEAITLGSKDFFYSFFIQKKNKKLNSNMFHKNISRPN